MKYWVGLLRDWALAGIVVVSAFVVFQYATAPDPLSEGPAPTFALPDLQGGEVDLASFGDQTVVLNFWFSDCGPCRAEIPELSAWSAANPDVPIIGVSTDQLEPNIVLTRARQLGITYRVAHDRSTQVARQYGVSLFPTTIVVREGQVRGVRMGGIDAAGLDALVAASRR